MECCLIKFTLVSSLVLLCALLSSFLGLSDVVVNAGDIEVTESNCQDMLMASDMLGLSDVVDACCTFLKQQLHPSNCVGQSHELHTSASRWQHINLRANMPHETERSYFN